METIKYAVRWFIKWSLIAAAFVGVGLIIASLYLQGAITKAQEQKEVIYQQVKIDATHERIEVLKDDVVTRLMQCESAGYSEDDGIIIFDTNGKASIGPLQFQKATLIHYYKTLYSKDITKKQAVEIALDRTEASQLAKDIIFTTDKGISNWINCDKKLGLSAEIKILKKLSK